MHIEPTRDIKPISDLRRHAAGLVRRLKETRRPLLLTQHGRPVAVLLDVEAYGRWEYERRLARAVAEGLQDAAKGRTRAHAEIVRAAEDWLKGA